MSDASRQKLKVSREGIVLIKSFEGFRPRAIQREGDGWVIGYGHTLSAREGASVSEADAELLLRYDLLPVEKSVNETVPGDLNQHQFDALVSFAFSVGVDRFAGSDVRQRLNAGATGEAADAIMGWPEPALPEAALRRRAAERALFVADPDSPVALSDLLSAPLPPPAVPLPVADEAELSTVDSEAVQPSSLEAEPVEPVEPVSQEPVAPSQDNPPVDPRGAAVAALLGEPVDMEPVIPVFGLVSTTPPLSDAPVEHPVASTENTDQEAAAEVEASDIADTPTPTDELAADEHPDADAVPDISEPPALASDEAPRVDETADSADVPSDTLSGQEGYGPTVDTVQLNAIRYAPYSAAMVGPIPVLRALDIVAANSAEADDADVAIVESTTDIAPEIVEPQTTIAVDEPLVIERAPFTAIDTASSDFFSEQSTGSNSESETFAPLALAPLVLTPSDDTPEPSIARPLWTAEERDAPDGSEINLFGEDLTLTHGGSVLRNDIEFEPPARFDWRETGPFIFMGGVGLVSFGASMAAFRRAAEQAGGSDLTIIGWVLALIGLGCVGVSSFNLYRRFGLPGGD